MKREELNLDAVSWGSRRAPVIAANGVVATSQHLAASAGLDVLRYGGNAVDAAIATAAMLTVVEPTSNGIGGDLFALVWDGGKLRGLNASGRAPRGLDADLVRAAGHTRMPATGWVTVTVPGQVAGWEALHRAHGTLEWERLLAPAIRYAREGFPVSPTVAALWEKAFEEYSRLEGEEYRPWLQTFAPSGRAPGVGETWRAPGHASTLERLAREGARAFYEGALAEAIVAFSRETGGCLAPEDLAGHEVEWVEPISVSYRGYEVWEIPPNGQGIAALMALGMLEGFDLPSLGHVSEKAWHLGMEAMKLAFADAHRWVADPRMVPVPVSALLDPGYLAARRALIGEQARAPEPGVPERGGTVYLCTADRDGMMVSLIQSNYHGFGSGLVVPGTGIALHNRGTGFSLEPGHPNELAPGKRPFHTIIPGFLTRGGAPVGPFGVMGAPMQPQGHVQTVIGTVDHHLHPQAVLDAPRWRVLEGLEAVVEPRIPMDMYRGLIARGHRLVEPSESHAFGRGQIIWRLEDGVFVAGTEPRADGAAAAW